MLSITQRRECVVVRSDTLIGRRHKIHLPRRGKSAEVGSLIVPVCRLDGYELVRSPILTFSILADKNILTVRRLLGDSDLSLLLSHESTPILVTALLLLSLLLYCFLTFTLLLDHEVDSC